MSSVAWIAFFDLARRILASNLEGISDSEALTRPMFGGNSVNWLAGHILVHRDRIHGVLGLDPAWREHQGASKWYRDGGDSADATVPLSVLRADLDRSQAAVLDALARISAERLAADATPTRTVAEQLALFGAHDWYHIGQIAMMRRLLGKPGAVG